ncbi:nucleoporin NUP42 [Sardina pilchardus]|uniref:nucleoporin NUP42 n=1 Tax=Sardina pilchardus TaxID=27697 RepID=UPI002E15847A
MTVCSFFLQGRCRYGEKCWNEHPRGGGGGGGGRGGGGGGGVDYSRGTGGGDYSRGTGGGDYSRGTPQSNRGGGGFGNRVWVNPQRAGGDFVKPTNFGGRDTAKNSSFGVSTQNRFGNLTTPSSFDRGGPKDENDKHLETIQKDMESWESSGQWLFSCYSVLKGSISGFVELSPEELRLEYYNGRASGDLQAYGSSVQQLASQWRNRLQELKAMNGNTRSSLIAELNNPGQQPSSFGSPPSAGFESMAPPSGFGSSAPSGFGAAPSAPASGFGSAGFGAPAPAPAQSSATFSFASNQTAAPSLFGSAQPSSQSAFGSAPGAAPSASSFSFAAPTAAVATVAATKDASGGFGASAAGFSFASSSAPSAGFGGGFGGSTGASGFGQPGFGGTNSGLFASAGASRAAASAGASASGLFTPQSELTADELKEFTGKRFTLGQIPLRPPPVDMLVV